MKKNLLPITLLTIAFIKSVFGSEALPDDPRNMATQYLANMKTSTINTIKPNEVHIAFEKAAKAENDPLKIIELWKAQQDFSKESKVSPDYLSSIAEYAIHYKLNGAAKAENDPLKIIELWKAQQDFSKESKVSPDYLSSIAEYTIHYKLNGAAKAENDPLKIIELWKAQQDFSKESKVSPDYSNSIAGYAIHYKLNEMAKAENDPLKIIELWKAQQDFSKESKVSPDYSNSIAGYAIHYKFSNYLEKENNLENVVKAYEGWEEFLKTNLLPSLSSTKPITSFITKYNNAKKELEKSQTLIIKNNNTQSVYASSSGTNTLTVAQLLKDHGSMHLDTSSLAAFKNSFDKLYKAASLRFHPDKKDPSADEKMRTLNAHKEWIASLDETTFNASPKN